jgi:hypothetical protein
MLTFVFGLLSILYGQYIFSWESTYFDGIMARKNNINSYIKAKYYLMVIFLCIIFLIMLTIFLLFSKSEFILLLFSFFIFEGGVMCFMILLIATFNDGRIDLHENTFLNYQGLNGNNLLLPLIILSLPVGLYSILFYLFNKIIATWTILGLGFLFLSLHKYWIRRIIMSIFLKRKYKNLEGYRKLAY